MPYNADLPEWLNAGTEPSETKKTEGWGVEEKPPAGWFNWFFNRVYLAIKELREKTVTNEELKVYKSGYDATNNVYTIVENKRPDGTLKEKSELGAYDAPTKRYGTRKITRYESDGVTVSAGYPITKTITYDGQGNVVSEV